MTIIKSRKRTSDLLALVGLIILAGIFGYLIIEGRIPGSG